MIKRLVLVGSLCLSVLFTTNAIAEPYLSDSAKQKYLEWIKEIRQTTHSARFALAVAPNGAWGSHWGYTIAQAKSKALKQCKKYAKSSPCEVVDVDGKSDFINQKTGEPLSYCYNTATNYWYFNNSLATCGSDIKVTKQEYTNKRLKQSGLSKTGGPYELLGSGSFVAQCEKNNKLDVSYASRNCDLEWNKEGGSTRCNIRNSVMTFHVYEGGGPIKLNFSSGELKHGANTYKCILAGDIKVVEEEDTSSTSAASSSSTSISTSGSASTSSTSSSSSKKGGSSELLSSGSFVAECEKNNELDVNYSGNRCDLEWNKLGESNRCKISNSIMTFQTYDSAGPAKLNFSSGELKHGANTYKCSLSGDIKVNDKEDSSSTSVASSSSSSSSSTTSSSGQIWCLTKGSLSRASQSNCETNSGQVITSSRAESFIGKGSVYCYYPKNNVWYWATGSCPAGEKEISKEEYYSLWCVAEGWTEVLQMDASKCDSNDGMVFATKPEAEIELKRLKQGSTSTAVKTAPDPVIELEYWQTVKDSNDPDLLQSYLDEYPNGKFAPLARLKIKKLQSSE